VDLYSVLGYGSGLYFIKPDMEPTALLRTLFLIHSFDSVLCGYIAAQSRRNKRAWAVAGFILGIWALGSLLVLCYRSQQARAV
jgi:hypothetical protein